MFHGVHPHGWPARFVGRSRSPLARVESAVSTFSPSPPPPPPPPTRHGRIYAKISECLRGVPLRA